jgi:dihydroorotase
MPTLIKNGLVVNEGKISKNDVLIDGEFIKDIIPNGSYIGNAQEIDAAGLHIFPGIIDDQVHFREPGLTHKGDIYTESRAAVAGGITSFMEMPNTVPSALTKDLLEQKYAIASEKSFANYSFFMGTSNTNLKDVLETDPRNVCGIKIFMGSSTGDMLVDNKESLEAIFRESKMLIATHCEDDPMIKNNLELFKTRFGSAIPFEFHPEIRSREACFKSSSFAANMAQKHNTRLHILHISTKDELELFTNKIPLKDKKITSEACIHHLWFSKKDYQTNKGFIKWNPAVKDESDRDAILNAVIDDTIDVVATDHAPHTIEEKSRDYLNCPSGGPLVQHALVAMLELHHQQKISLEKIADKMSHKVAELFAIEKRGFIKQGFYADLALVDLNNPWVVNKSNILYKSGWSPFEGQEFKSKVMHTFVNGNHAYNNGTINENNRGKRLLFDRK